MQKKGSFTRQTSRQLPRSFQSPKDQSQVLLYCDTTNNKDFEKVHLST